MRKDSNTVRETKNLYSKISVHNYVETTITHVHVHKAGFVGLNLHVFCTLQCMTSSLKKKVCVVCIRSANYYPHKSIKK